MSSIFQSFGSNNRQALPVSLSQPTAGAESKVNQRQQPQQQHRQSDQQAAVQEQQKGDGLRSAAAAGGLRRRLSTSSLSLKLPISSPSPAAEAAGWVNFRRSKSVSSVGEYAGTSIRKWWDWGWSWILSRKPTFARDLEMNQEEMAALGCHSKGSWRRIFYKVRSELRRMLGSDQVGLPQTFRYDSTNYSMNFDNAAPATGLGFGATTANTNSYPPHHPRY